MKARGDLRRWVGELAEHPFVGFAGFAVGLLFSIATSFLERLATHRESAMIVSHGLQNLPTFLGGILGAALLLWILVQIPSRKQRRIVFVICIFLGALAGLLVFVIATGLASYHF